MIPFFIYYSMFGFQRIGDLIWAAADTRARGFLLGGTAGPDDAGRRRPAAPGRPQPRLLALAVPNCMSYDPAFAYELAVIIQDGIRRMYSEQESIFYYLTVMNEQYAMPPMPEGVARGHPEGMYRFQRGGEAEGEAAGAAVRQRRDPARGARGAGDPARSTTSRADVWSVTSYNELYRDGHACERWNLLHPAEKPRVPYVTQCLQGRAGRDRRGVRLLKVLPDLIDRWMPRPAASRSAPTASAAARTARAARLLRGRRRVHRRRDARARWRSDGKIDAKVVGAGDQGSRDRPEKPNPANS